MESGKNLFAGLPPPSSTSLSDQSPQPPAGKANPKANEDGNPAVELRKGALKRDKRSVSLQTDNNKEDGDNEEGTRQTRERGEMGRGQKEWRKESGDGCTQKENVRGGSCNTAKRERMQWLVVGSKRVRFKMTVDASTKQVVDAMQKITTHIGNPSKFSKASKLTLQLIQAGSVKAETCDPFFEILRAAMSSPSSCTDSALRADYHELFSAVHDILDCFNREQQKQVETWIIRAQVANDLFTDDSFVFSKAAGRIRQEISSLPEISAEEDMLEEALDSGREDQNGCVDKLEVADQGAQMLENQSDEAQLNTQEEEESDPFGLDALLPKSSKKDEKVRKRREEMAPSKKLQDNVERCLRAHREALMGCLEIAAARYRVPWAQTVIDILVKHAFDNKARFTAQQRDAIEKLWASIREQQVRRRQGKSTTGKLDVTAFERLQERYANEKISIRHAVGDSGERRAQQWLG